MDHGLCPANSKTPVDLTVTAADLGLPDSESIPEGGRLLQQNRTKGRFPTGLAVARVISRLDERGQRRSLFVDQPPSDRAIFWNHMLDDLPPVREVTILRTLGIDPRGGDARDILREAVHAECNLCLIYASSDESGADAEYVGVLFEAAAVEPLAVFRATADIPEEVRKACLKTEHRPHRSCNPDCTAEARLRDLVRNALWDLTEMDETTAATQPSPWGKALPLLPRDDSFWNDLLRNMGRRRG